jgi:mercuric reductase
MIRKAVEHLNTLLPLKARQDKLPSELKRVHQYILHTLITDGKPPSREQLKSHLGKDNIDNELLRLSRDDLIVLDKEDLKLLGAYPVTMEKTPHRIIVNEHTLYAMCALDAVSIAPVFKEDVVIDSVCYVSGTPIHIFMQGPNVLEVQPSDNVMVGIRWQEPTEVAAHSLCMEMVFLQDKASAEDWKNTDSDNISLFSLADAISFGTAFFEPLIK